MIDNPFLITKLIICTLLCAQTYLGTYVYVDPTAAKLVRNDYFATKFRILPAL